MSKPDSQEAVLKEQAPPKLEEQTETEQEAAEPKPPQVTDNKLRESQLGLAKIEKIVTKTHGRELWIASMAAIAVAAALSMDQRSNPLLLIFEGGSGRGKSFVINLLVPDRQKTTERLYRLDQFTPKAFVSHAANKSGGQLANIDLLRKLKDKTLLVKELAPIFRGREDALRDNFSILTSVLDGKGHRSASGTHGTRGYEGRFVFNFLGATTPIPLDTDRIMAQLGNRMFRYEIVGGHNTEDGCGRK